MPLPDAHPTSLRMMYWASRKPPSDPKTSFAGKPIVVTGATTGLGFEAAIKFAALNARRLILGVRSLKRGEEAKAQVCQRTGYEESKLHVYELDMSTFASVRAFAQTLQEKEARLDIAILNAGVAAPTFNLSPEGYEISLQVCVLSTALLAVLLLSQLRRSSELSGTASHLELVGSVAHHNVNRTTFSDLAPNVRILDMLNDPTFFQVERQYNINKLLVMYITHSLADQTDPDKVIINAVCPALCRTSLGRDFPTLMKIPVSLFQLVFARSAEQGARSYVSGAALGAEGHGEFWSHDVFYT